MRAKERPDLLFDSVKFFQVQKVGDCGDNWSIS